MVNQAALDGWVKTMDPKSGRPFYANHVTRVTQWDAPPGWNEAPEPIFSPPPAAPASQNGLPPGWEEMKDPATGRSFYVDHARQITTWTRPPSNVPNTDASYSTGSMTQSRNAVTNSSLSSHWTALQQPAASARQANQAAQTTLVRSNSNVSNVSLSRRSWATDASFFRPSPYHQDADFSDSMSKLDFKVQKVEDRLRPTCGGCDEIFTLSKRRHHCRLCGDVFCHDCSPHKASLPLEGPEFEKPVRICKTCFPDVDAGNFFSLRRYLTPLTLYDPPSNERSLDEEEGVATAANVSAALCALTSDLDALILNATDVDSRLSIAPEILIPAITKHLTLRATSDRAVRAIASLLSLGSIVNDTKWALMTHKLGGRVAVENILSLLERSGSDRRTLFVQEQAAKTIFYLSDVQILKQLSQQNGGEPTIDIPRSVRAMLDHASNSKNTNLQRWAASSIRHLVCEDERRTTISANAVASALASGQDFQEGLYESFLPELISTGGILILCSLIGADDSDTRAHATGALGVTLEATRAVNESLNTLYDMTGGQAGRTRGNVDGDIIRSIVQGGGCDNSLSFLLQSAENGIARMGVDFCASLVMPLLEDARGSATLDEGYSCGSDSSSLGASREAALAVARGPCLPSLLAIVKDPEMGGRIKRPMDLKKTAMESLAAISMAVGEMNKANFDSTVDAVDALLEEGVLTTMLAILESGSSQTLSNQDTPSARIRECAGIVISALSTCSAEAMVELQSCHAITTMLGAMGDMGPSTLRGDKAPKCLGMLQTAAALLTFSQHDKTTPADLVDRLLEAVDAGAVSTLSRILFTKVEWDSEDKAVGAMKARDAACRMLTAMFGMAQTDEMAHQRLWDVVDADAYERNPPRNIVTGALGVLQAAGRVGRNSLLGERTGTHYRAAVMDLVESSLYAVGSMCGSAVVPGLEHVVESIDMMELNTSDDMFSVRRREACAVACDILTVPSRTTQQSILPTMLVGGFGEKTLTASLRLALAICQNGSLEQHAKLASSGILIPVSDLLKSAMSAGNQFRFSACLALVRFCGPHVGTGAGGGGIASVQAAIRTATHILSVPTDPNAPLEHTNNTEALKAACIQTIESLSSNASLWSAISKDALPSIVNFLHSACDERSGSRNETLCGALRAIARIVGLQSHAVSAARAGLAVPLGRLLVKGASGTNLETCDELPFLAMEVLHVLSVNRDARHEAKLLESGVVEGVCCALGSSATSSPKKPSDGRADICFWALEILHHFIEDIGSDFQTAMQSPLTAAFVAIVSREPRLSMALCSTLLLKSTMKVPRFNSEDGETFDVPTFYGPPLLLVKERCSGFKDTHYAAMNLFFVILLSSCALEDAASDTIWSTLALTSMENGENCKLTLFAFFLNQLSERQESPFMPAKIQKRDEFNAISRPLVRHGLLEAILTSIRDRIHDEYVISMLVAFEIPRVCLEIWQDPNLVQLSFEIIKVMLDAHEENLVHIFIESKQTLLSLFDMLNVSKDIDAGEEIRNSVASILVSLAENRLLTEAVDKFGIKSEAIAGLASACLADEHRDDDDDDKLATSATLSSRCMECLVDLLKSSAGKDFRLESRDATSIATTLGQKICRMVISRFLERAKLSQYEVDEDEDVMDAGDVKMLCAIAQHENSLNIISSVGGISALALVAGEGNLSAVVALKKANPTILLDSNGHLSIMKLLLDDAVLPDIETAALDLLTELSNDRKGRNAIVEADDCGPCIQHALFVIGAHSYEDVSEADVEVDVVPSSNMDDDIDTKNDIIATPGEVKNVDASISQELKVVALSFLANLSSVKLCRDIMIEHSRFIPTLGEMCQQDTAVDVQTQAVRLMASLAPFGIISGRALNCNQLAESLICGIANSSLTSTKCTASEGLLVIIHSVSIEYQSRAMEEVVKMFISSVKRTTIARSLESEAEKASIARLVCLLASLIVQVSPKDHLRVKLCCDMELLKSMVHLVEWRYDSVGTSSTEDYGVFWDAAASYAIQHCSSVICDTLERQEQINLESLTKTVLTMARPGKAPRKTCDFKTALERVIATKRDAAGAIAAHRILGHLLRVLD